MPDEKVEKVYLPKRIKRDAPSLAYAFSDALETAAVLGLEITAGILIGKVCSMPGGCRDYFHKQFA